MHETRTILLAEDDPIDVMSVQRALKKNHISNRLVTVGNGEEALDYLYNRGDFRDRQSFPIPGLILLDINMPRMNGLELLEVIKKDHRIAYIPIVILTSSQNESDIRKGFMLQAAGYIVKPVAFDSFCQAISTIDRYWSLSMVP